MCTFQRAGSQRASTNRSYPAAQQLRPVTKTRNYRVESEVLCVFVNVDIYQDTEAICEVRDGQVLSWLGKRRGVRSGSWISVFLGNAASIPASVRSSAAETGVDSR
jgi:hypothetical protein